MFILFFQFLYIIIKIFIFKFKIIYLITIYNNTYSKMKSAINKSKVQQKDNNVTITDDKMINEVLCNIGKKSKDPVKKSMINDFIDNKSNTKKKIK